jgi:hypothetical protein
MTGGLLQLVSVGYADMFLTHKPEITMWKKVYKRHTNFAIEAIPQFFNTKPDFGSRVTCTISKNADMISRMYLVVNLPPIGKFLNVPGEAGIGNASIAKCAWIKNIGFQLVKLIELEIGGVIVDRQYSDWLFIWSQLTTTSGKKRGLDMMIGNKPELYTFTNGKESYQLYVPLYFWFCIHSNLALPLVAMETAEVKVNIEFNTLDNCLVLAPSHYMNIDDDVVLFKPGDILRQTVKNVTYYAKFVDYDVLTKRLYYTKITPEPFVTSQPIVGLANVNDALTHGTVTPASAERLYLDKTKYFSHLLNLSLGSAYLLVDYIYLDLPERLKFLRSDHEYLIDVVQFDNDKLLFHSNNKIKVGYNNLCKELVFRGQYDYLAQGYAKEKFAYTNMNGNNLIKKAKLLLNGQERIKDTSIEYFEWLQPYQAHKSPAPDGVSVYSFALTPETHQPTGAVNLSMVNDIVLDVTVDKGVSYQRPIKMRVYSLTSNILRIIDGVVSVAF